MATSSSSSAARKMTPTTSKTTTSYAAAAAADSSTSSHENTVQDLYLPAPTSFSLVAALLLLDNPLHQQQQQHQQSSNNATITSTSVFLIPQSYLQNWIIWAYHQPVPQEEMRRIQVALRIAAERYRLVAPKLNELKYHDPGPMDNSELATTTTTTMSTKEDKQTSSLLLRSNVVVWDGTTPKNNNKQHVVYTCAVPERFYEFLRSVHGVVCDDGQSVAFQAEPPSILIYHHDPVNRCSQEQTTTAAPKPMDFRRAIVYEQQVIATQQSPLSHSSPQSPMTKLLKNEAATAAARAVRNVATVEVYPPKFTYRMVMEDDDNSSTTNGKTQPRGFVLVSKASNVVDALQAIMKELAPTKSSQCVRLWTRHGTNCDATTHGDGYELILLDKLDGTLLSAAAVAATNGEATSNSNVTTTPPKSIMTIQEFIQRHTGTTLTHELDLYMETRPSMTSPWIRQNYELSNRIQVGDYVDAQDTTGKWYEAIVRKVEEHTVEVHYAGWATKWNGTIRRRHDGPPAEGASKLVNAPEPLWTHTTRWREQIKKDHMVEIRESSSQLKKPKWFRGYIRKVGGVKESPRPIMGGAPLEMLDWIKVAENGTTSPGPLLLLNRTQQVQVEVPSEKQSRPSVASRNGGDSDNPDVPPYVRWVNLYGEEICKAGTHMKLVNADSNKNKSARPTTVRYEWDQSKPAPVEVLKSHMHGAGFVRESLRGQPAAPGSVGLQNLGNSCYMNSIVQCFNHCDIITQYFLHEAYAKDVNRNNPLGSGGAVALAYGSLLSDIWGAKYSVLAPRLLKKTVANFAPQFNNIYQHDSHEFCSFLMDGLHEDCNRVEKKPYVEDLEGFGMPDGKIAIESWRRHLLRHDSIIVDHCQGMHRSHVTCPICGRESIKFDVFSSLSVPLPASKDGTPVPLDDCLEKFTEGEQLDENNAWYCQNCKRHVCALKMLALWTIPDILIIHLKRFTYENRNGRVVRSKLEDEIVFPIDNLNMRQYVLGPIDEDAPPVYNLFGVSEHSGTTANSGHYTATVRNSQDGKWYRYNDSNVGSSSGEASVTGGAYLLFYKRAKGVSRWGGIEKAMMDEEKMNGGSAQQKSPRVVVTDKDGFTTVKTKKNKGRSRR